LSIYKNGYNKPGAIVRRIYFLYLWEIRQIASKSILINKNSRVVSFEEGVKVANQNKIPFLEVSAKVGINIEEIFIILSRQIINNI
jgi:hypothetical protein